MKTLNCFRSLQKKGLYEHLVSVLFLVLVVLAAESHAEASNNIVYEPATTHPHETENNRNEYHHLPTDYSFRNDGVEYRPPVPDSEGYRWWKGNLHTHTLWSDGDQFPEVVTQWYYEHGYHFLALSDHNILMEGQNWIDPQENRYVIRGGGSQVLDIYLDRFGPEWVETRKTDGRLEVRLKPLSEVRALFEQAGRFIMIPSEEITEREHLVHVNATNIAELIEPITGGSITETIHRNIEAVLSQQEETGQPMIPHLNHPNWRNSLTAEHMAPVENLRLFEVYNGHRGVQNFGTEDGVKDLDRVWDIMLTRRLGELGLDLIYGVATDDTHHYESSTSDVAEPGRGWVKVRSRFLTPESVVHALRNGEFYSSTGVTLASVDTDGHRFRVEVEPEAGVSYTIQFIGTRKGYDLSSRPYVDAEGNVRLDRTRIYSDDIGVVLHEVTGNSAEYRFSGDELYVRAKIISTKLKANPFAEGEKEKAWLQPVRPAP